MNKCPHCGKEVEALRGECKHCHGDLNAEGFRVMLEGIDKNTSESKRTVEELQKETEAQKKRIEYLENLNKERAEFQDKLDRDGRPKPVNVMNVVRGLMLKDFRLFPYEEQVIKENQERMLSERSRGSLKDDKGRALDTGAVGTGGAIIPPEYLPQELIDMLRAKIICEALGCRVLSNLTGSPVTIPRLASGATAYDVAENSAKTPSDQGFELLSLIPHEVAAATIYSKRMALLSNPSVDRMIQDDLMKVLARRIDWLALYGGLLPNQAVGIINTVGIGTYTLINDAGNGATPVPADLDGIEVSLENADADEGTIGWAMAPRTKGTFKGMREDSGAGAGTGGYLFRAEMNTGKLDGYTYKTTTQIPINETKGASVNCSHLVYGNWDDLVIAYWGGLELAASDQAGTAFLNNQVVIKASMLYDFAVRHEASFRVTDGVRP